MPRFKTAEFRFRREGADDLQFKCAVNVSTEGLFTTYLPEYLVEQFEGYGIKMEMNPNRMTKKGFFSAHSYAELEAQINKVCKKAISRKLDSETIILRYAVKSRASYATNENGDKAPNARAKGFSWNIKNEGVNSYGRIDHGFSVYCEPYIKRVYSYLDGKQHTEYDSLLWDYKTECLHLKFLSAVIQRQGHSKLDQEMDYTPQRAAFFENLIRMTWNIHEIITNWNREGIQMLIDTGMIYANNLLTEPSENEST